MSDIEIRLEPRVSLIINPMKLQTTMKACISMYLTTVKKWEDGLGWEITE